MQKTIIYSIIAAILTLCLAEWIYGAFFYHPNSKTALFLQLHHPPYTPYPYISFKEGGNTLGPEQGYIGPAPSKKKDHTFRIFIMGGSATVQNKLPFSMYLEKNLIKAGHKNIKVFNFGVVSSVIGQDISRILHELVDYHPNLVIFYNGYNEFMHPFYADPRPGYPFNFFVEEENPLRKIYPKDYPLLPLVLFKSSLLRRILAPYFYEKFTNIESLRGQVNFNTKEWEKKIVDSYWTYIQKARSLGKAFKFKVLVIFQPIRDNSSSCEGVYEYLCSYISKNNPFFFDRRDFFSNIKEDVFTDQVHIKSKYEVNVANEITDILLNNKFLTSVKRQ